MRNRMTDPRYTECRHGLRIDGDHDGLADGASLAEVGAAFGLPRSNIDKIQRRAIRKLWRDQLRARRQAQP